MWARILVVLLPAALAAGGCGRVVPAGGEVVGSDQPAAARSPVVEPADLIPADLDLVLRFDLGQIRDSLGSEGMTALSEQALSRTGPEDIVRQAIEHADVVWLGLRVADISAGDRVLIVEHAQGVTEPEGGAWRRVASPLEGLALLEAVEPPARHGTARILTMGKRATIFVSPVETAAVDRVLRTGADAERGQPAARGLVSLAWRVRKLSPGFENSYPSLASLVAKVARAEATFQLLGGELRLDARFHCRSEPAAQRLQQVLATFAAAGKELEGYASLLSALQLSRADSTVEVRWPLPREAVLAALRDPESLIPEEDLPSDEPAPAAPP